MNIKESTILVTGGAGYIGSHTVVQLLNEGSNVIVLDNLCNSKSEVIKRISKITSRQVEFIHGDIRDRSLLQFIFKQYGIDVVIHFAGLKAVGESVSKPLEYYDNNVAGSLTLIKEMEHAKIKNLVFSSSATVYGNPSSVPITETFPLKAINPYGQSKLMVENILHDLYNSDSSWNISILRYFNPVGAHESGLIGEDPNGVPSNLLPFIAHVAAGKQKSLAIYGDDYPTLDGTGIRDYIHVDDLARGHLAAIEAFSPNGSIFTLNLGTGRGYSVFEMINAFERASGKAIPYHISDRRIGDVAECYANSNLAKEQIGWFAEHGIERICIDAWRWQSNYSELG